MSISVAADLSRHLPTMPTLVWRDHEELGRLALWVRENAVRHIALHPGALRGAEEWSWWLGGLTRLRDLLAAATPMPLLAVTGPCAADRVVHVLNAWPVDVTFVTQHPWELAIHGKALRPDLGDERAARDESVKELFQANCSMFHDYVNAEVHKLGARRSAESVNGESDLSSELPHPIGL
jgi:hypothetical protein